MMPIETLAAPPLPTVSEPPNRNVSVGYLRWLVTLLVVLHHAVLAYSAQGPKPGVPLTTQPLMWTAFPVVDTAHWPGFQALVGFNDIYFMALMFFISGLFVSGSLQRKGAVSFAWDRIKRLGVPFAIASAVIAPLAYYPAYLQSGHFERSFWQTWLSLPFWPSGPAWFIWVLLAFGLAAAGLQLIMRDWTNRLARLAQNAEKRMWKFWLGLVVASAATYITLSIVFDPYSWLSWGPFSVQSSRILHYAVYYIAGIAVGAYGLDRGLLAAKGKLARRWWLLPIQAVLAFMAVIGIVVAATTSNARPSLAMWEAIGGWGFAMSCALSSFMLLSLFVRFAKRRNFVFDSLERNAYGIYLVHYAFVSWVQYSLLPVHLDGLSKGMIAFGSAFILSWATTALLRRVPGIARII